MRDYGVERHAIAGCVVSDPLIKYAGEYNEVIERHLQAKYGPKVFHEIEGKAEALYAERHPPVEKPSPAR